MNIWQFTDKLNTLTESKLVEISINAIKEKDVIFLNQEHLKMGYDSNNKELPEYSKNTLKIKEKTNGYISPSGRIALRDTRKIFDAMDVRKEKDFLAL